jgi:predicted nucleic acid-binding protein
VILPAVVRDELKHLKAPFAVRDWIAAPPAWVNVRQTPSAHLHDESMEGLDAGEEDAIALAIELHADLVLIGDEDGVIVARGKGLEVTGTLGLLSRAAQRQHFMARILNQTYAECQPCGCRLFPAMLQHLALVRRGAPIATRPCTSALTGSVL